MRLFAFPIFALGTIFAAPPAAAQTYAPGHPVCLHVYGRIAYYDCSYSSISECNASASGRAAGCEINPYYVAPPGRPRTRYRRHGHAY